MSKIDQAIEVLRAGGIAIYPTDTAFGIGCRIDRPEAVKRLFTLRKRPVGQAMPVLVSTAFEAQKYFQSPLPDIVRQLMDKYWPGALTIVYKHKKGAIFPLVSGGSETVGLRMPNHETALALIRKIGVPILGPSANFHGASTPFEFEDIDKELIKLVDFVLPGECKLKQASTVVDCTGKTVKIIRQGAVKV